jgi:acetyltransferase-like isoleucine patch superfamily enzyme
MDFDFYVDQSAIASNTRGEANSRIYAGARVFDCQLSDNATIGDFTTARESVFGEWATIQRYNDIIMSNIGRYSCTGRFTTIHRATIGAFCAFSWNISIGGDNHDPNLLSTHPFYYNATFGMEKDGSKKRKSDLEEMASEPCIIGNDVWVGAGTMINRNLTIGNGAIIGAGAVIIHDVEPYAVVVGVPGRVIKKRFDDKTIGLLEKLKWWELPSEVLADNRDLFKSHLDEQKLEKLSELSNKFLGKKI